MTVKFSYWVTAVSRDPGLMELFAIGDDDGLVWTTSWDAGPPTVWHNWYPIASKPPFPPFFASGRAVTAVVRDPARLDLFAVSANTVWGTWFDASQPTAWHNWYQVAANPPNFSSSGQVAAVARDPDHLDLFTVGYDGRLWTTQSESDASQPPIWTDWALVLDNQPFHPDFPSEASVTAVARDPGHLELFAIGDDSRVWTAWWDASQPGV